MALLLSDRQLDNPTQWYDWDPVTDDSALRLVDPSGKSQAVLRHTHINQQGLFFSEEIVQVEEPLSMDLTRGDNAFFVLEMSFTLSGYNHTEDIEKGENFFFLGWREPDFKAFYTWHAQDQVSKFDLYLSDQVLQSWLIDRAQDLPQSLRPIVDGSAHFDQGCVFWQKQVTTASMHTVIQQLLTCPYQGLMQSLYREAKSLELLSMRLSQLQDPYTRGRRPLAAPEVERIWWAEQILLERLTDPPTLTELARLVGLNDFNLKRGFKQVFGTTVFGYLLQHRMDQARQLLLDSPLTIEAVASKVGYASRNAFARAFRKHYGVYPKDYRRDHLPS